jgi:hypothetical protein
LEHHFSTLQNGIEKLAKRWYRPLVMKGFVDKSQHRRGQQVLVAHRIRIVAFQLAVSDEMRPLGLTQLQSGWCAGYLAFVRLQVKLRGRVGSLTISAHADPLVFVAVTLPRSPRLPMRSSSSGS